MAIKNANDVKLRVESDAWSDVAEAFGRKARIYDEFGRQHTNLERMRAKVRAHVQQALPAGRRLLEINAGTGADACYFARQGYYVHATDLSAGMAAEIRVKASREGLDQCLTVQQLSFTQLEEVQGAPFDGMLSNMGGVNCTPDLRAITDSIPGVLKPGGIVIWVVMPPICLWELAQGLHGDLRLASRRLRPGGVVAQVEGLPVPTYYHSPRRVRAAFGSDFQILRLQGLSVFTPPADHKDFPRVHPRLYRWLVRLDDRLSDRFPFHSWGDFYILSLRYQPSLSPLAPLSLPKLGEKGGKSGRDSPISLQAGPPLPQKGDPK
jgi:ubiquinone/menaquinone biosynthesis C-methylase UbiE